MRERVEKEKLVEEGMGIELCSSRIEIMITKVTVRMQSERGINGYPVNSKPQGIRL